jgi:hypothetical protein
MPKLTRLVVRLSSQRPGFSITPFHMGLVNDKVALGQDFFDVLRISPVSIIPPILHTHTFIYETSLVAW